MKYQARLTQALVKTFFALFYLNLDDFPLVTTFCIPDPDDHTYNVILKDVDGSNDLKNALETGILHDCNFSTYFKPMEN